MNILTRVLALNTRRSVGRACLLSCEYSRVKNLACHKSLLTYNWVRLASQSNSTHTCWNCHSSYEKILPVFCEKCQVIQKPSSTENYFKMLSFDKNFELDVNLLSKKYKDAQRLLHPDKFTMKSQEEQDIAAEFSSLINKAYSTLRNPWLRGVYLLKLQGINFDETTTADDPGFLLRIMEINEALADSDSVEELKRMQRDNSLEVESVSRKLSQAFQGKDFETAKRHLITLRYLTNISDKISEKLYSLGERL